MHLTPCSSPSIAISFYTLKATIPHQKDRQGALLRVETENGYGYADCHPWPELGDLPLLDQLKNLKESQLTPLTTHSLQYALLDAEARFKELSLIPPSHGLKSHYLINHIESKVIEEALSLGFTHFKVKVGFDLANELKSLHLLASYLKHPHSIRLDFNEKLSYETFIAFLREARELLPWLDFIEDPFPYHSSLWHKTQQAFFVKLACDRLAHEALHAPQSASIVVCKPAVYLPKQLSQATRLLVTSYLDHPIGQLCALYYAIHYAEKYPKSYIGCGVVSHVVYQTNEFSRELRVKEGSLLPPEEQGYGWGFNDLLQRQIWIPLHSLAI